MKKYTKKDFLEYASAFDYQNDIDEGNITGYKTDKEIKDDMKKWKLKDFHTHFGFSHFNEYSGDHKLQQLEIEKYGDVNQGIGTWNGYEYVKNK